jgi:hypothetical protein
MWRGDMSADVVNRDERLARGMDQLRAMVRADGAHFALSAVTGVPGEVEVVYLDLILESSACAECVLPVSMLEKVCYTVLRGVVPELAAVRIHDPRLAPP